MMIDALYIFLITSTALLMGNEFCIAFFIHPSLSKADHKRFIPAIQVFAELFGRVMPFWMGGTLLLHLALAWFMWSSHHSAGIYTLYAAITWAFIVIFSVILPVPINNRVGLWNPSDLPPNWESERKLWDIYNSTRVGIIGFAFVLLLFAYRNAL
ncbi:MAG TPA: DUF1772 domain-containing protein [Candidatus Methylacidiphilales bacterium]|nr:DUF1772 domain-containing protein [Candidatus Methylacidiphilales bacterium]